MGWMVGLCYKFAIRGGGGGKVGREDRSVDVGGLAIVADVCGGGREVRRSAGGI